MVAAAVLAVALAIDAAAAAAVCGLRAPHVRAAHALRIATLTGVFQAAMAAFGWIGGRALGDQLARWDHWIAFGLLTAFGLKTIVSALRDGAAGEPEPAAAADVFGWGPLVVLAFATSIDALAAGVTLPLLAPPPAATLALIGGVTFALVLVAVHAGRAIATRAGRGLEILGGVAMIAIGVKILVEHVA